MDLIANRNSGIGIEKTGTHIPVTPVEKFVNGVYSSVDKATVWGLERLRSEDGIIPSCKLGCWHCCRYLILTNTAEAHTLAKYIKRELPEKQINDIRMRTLQWHQWDNSRPGRYPSAHIDAQIDLSGYDHCCPLLADGACIAYPVRPVVCRTHFVCSHPEACCAASDAGSTENALVVLTSVVTAASPFSTAITDYLENEGVDFSRAVMLLPHALAIEMGWDFALSL